MSDADPHSYQNVREKWTHEDDLLNHRLTWLLVSQTLLFAAYGAVLKIRIDLQSLPVPRTEAKVEVLVRWLPRFGLITSLLIFFSVFAAALALRELKRRYPEAGVDVKSYTSAMGLIASLGLPLTFLAAWLKIIFS
jgi:heme/copper-type cytochrome/quinol oxidase subunit 3